MLRRGKLYQEKMAAAFICASISFSSSSAQAGNSAANPLLTPLSNTALFSRCYAHMTRNPVPAGNTLMAQVKAGTLDPIAACMQVLQSANLISESNGGSNGGYLPGVGSASTQAMQVLKTFQNFHRTWFGNQDLTLINEFGNAWGYYSMNFYDTGEPALHLTRALFQAGIPYKNLVTTDPLVEALRTNSLGTPETMPVTYYPGPLGWLSVDINANQQNISGSAFVATLPVNTVTVPRVQTGDLLGVRAMSASKTSVAITSIWADGQGIIPNNPNQGFGGGVIGSPAYVMENLGTSFSQLYDGGLNVPRLFGQAVLSNFLCRNLPVLRTTDGALYVEPAPAAGVADTRPPFRKGSSCMSCHQGMDPIAYTVRNLNWGQSQSTLYASSLGQVVNMGSPAYGGSYDGTFGTPPAPQTTNVDSEPLFSMEPPSGSLNYRSYDGTLVNQPVMGLAGLGAAIAQTNDYYVCAAERYFQYFTGITANLQDIGDTALTPISSSDMVYRNFVIQLGLDLKKSQNLQSLVQEIIQSDIYRSPSMKTSTQSPGSSQ